MDRDASWASHYPQILRFVHRRVRTREEAEDAAQDAFASAADALARSAMAAPPTLAWLYTVARRRLIDERRRRRIPTLPLELVREAESQNDPYGGLVARALDVALAALPEGQRRVVVLRLLEGRSFAEIARTLGATEAACRARFMRGLERLRTEFEQEGIAP